MKTFKTQFYPTAQQQEYIKQACGVRRWTWNWAVATYFEAAKQDKFPSMWDLQKQLNNTLVKDPEYSWLLEVNSMARGEALKDFGLSLKAYAKARHESKRTVKTIPVDKYKPKFKKKGKCTESFRLFNKSETEFKVHSAHDFSVVTVRGKQRLHIHPIESVEFLMSADIKTCTISMKGGKFFMSVSYEKANQRARTCGSGKIGIDLGIKHVATCYDGSKDIVFDIPSTLKAAERRTERCNERLAHTTSSSKRHQKLLLQLERAYMHEANIKKDWREKFTTYLVENYNEIVLDDFNFESAKNLDANRALYRVGSYAFKLRLEEKAASAGAEVRYVPKGTPTTKQCSCCGNIKSMKLSDRIYSCPVCGSVLDRDQNSAHNVFVYEFVEQ